MTTEQGLASIWADAVPSWVAAVAASVAALAAVAVWIRGRTAVAWRLDLAESGLSKVVNDGNASARDVHIRVGGLSDPGDEDSSATASVVQPGEALSILVSPTFTDPEDYSVVVSWRPRLGRRKQWSYPVI